MARYIGPKCKKCRKSREKLFLRGEKCQSDKCTLMKRGEMPEVRGHTPMNAGSSGGRARIASTKAVQSAGDAPGQAQPHTRVRNAAGMDSVRRRLSIIFQRLTGERRSRRIQGSSCQSPRAQRCCRATAVR